MKALAKNTRPGIPWFALLFGALLLQTTPPSEAARISGDLLARALEICLASLDSEPINAGNRWGCCASSNGRDFCVVCTGEPSANLECEIEYDREVTIPQIDQYLEIYSQLHKLAPFDQNKIYQDKSNLDELKWQLNNGK